MKRASNILILAAALLWAAPAFAQYDEVEADPCASQDVKEFLQGNFVVLGFEKDEAHAVPDQKDLYAGAAEMKRITDNVDDVKMWMLDLEGAKGNKLKYYFQMYSDFDNYPVLRGWGDGAKEFWSADQEGRAACSAPA